METYTPNIVFNTNPNTQKPIRNIETHGVCAIGNGKYAVASTIDVEISPDDWQPVGQISIINENGGIERSMTYYYGQIAPIGYIKFNNVAFVPGKQLHIFDSTIDLYSSTIVPNSARQKVWRFIGIDDDYSDRDNLKLRSNGVLIIAGARRPVYHDSNKIVVCGNWQAAFFAVDVDSLTLLNAASFPCNEANSEAPFDFSEYTSLRFQYVGYNADRTESDTLLRQRVAFIGSARAANKTNLDILASRCDLYYIATGENYASGSYPAQPSFLTRTFWDATGKNDNNEVGLDIDMRFRVKTEGVSDWKYVICGYLTTSDTSRKLAIAFVVLDSLQQDNLSSPTCVKNEIAIFYDTVPGSTQATAVTWVAPQNHPNQLVRWYNSYTQGYIIAGLRTENPNIGSQKRTFLWRRPYPGNGTPNYYAEYGLGLPDTVETHPGYTLLSRISSIDSSQSHPGRDNRYSFHLAGWWKDINGLSLDHARYFAVNDDLTPLSGHKYATWLQNQHYGWRMTDANDNNDFVIIGDNLLQGGCDNYYTGGGLPFAIKVTSSGLFDTSFCDISHLPNAYQCKGNIPLITKSKPCTSSLEHLNCSTFNPPEIFLTDTTIIKNCPMTLCTPTRNTREDTSVSFKTVSEKEHKNSSLYVSSSSLTIYPNPASDYFTVRYANSNGSTLSIHEPNPKRYFIKIADERFAVFQKNISSKS